MNIFNTHCSDCLVLILFAAVSAQASAVGNDPLTGSAQLSSAQLVQAVLARNPSLPAMQAAWEAARASIEQASALADPMLSYAVAPETAGATGLDFGQRLELSQALPWPGKRRLRGEAARHEATAAHEDIGSLRIKLIAAAKVVCADWYFIHEAIRINRVNQDLLKEFRSIAESKYSTGLATKQDALRADVEFNLLVHQAIVLERERREVLARINTLLNRAPDYAVPPPSALADADTLPDVETLRTQATKSRPELKLLTARVQAVKARTGLARKDFYPDFTVRAGYNSLWDRQEKRFTVGVGINIPLDRSKRQAAEDESRARMKQAEWELVDKRSAVAGEVQRAYDRAQESRHVLALYGERLLSLAEENLQAAKADYQAGSGDFLTLISAEKNLMQTQLRERQALADSHRRTAELERAVGAVAREDAVTRRRNTP